MNLVDSDKQIFVDFYKNHSVKDVIEYFNTNRSSVDAYMAFHNIKPHTRAEIGVINSNKQTVKIPKDELIKLFIDENKTRKELAEYYGCSEALIKKRCREYGISKPRNLSRKNLESSLIDKYGTIRIDKIGKEKTEKTNMIKYGAKTPFESSLIQSKVTESKRQSNPSSLELRIMMTLSELGVPYSREVFYKEDVVMTFDFVIFNKNTFGYIEADGFHHFKNIVGHDRVERANRTDTIKDEFCDKNDIPLKRIKYTDTDEEIKNSIEEFFLNLKSH